MQFDGVAVVSISDDFVVFDGFRLILFKTFIHVVKTILLRFSRVRRFDWLLVRLGRSAIGLFHHRRQ